MSHSNLYETLELTRDASIDDIKKSYRKLAFKYHPDRNKDPDSSEKFQRIAHSYSILSDPSKKKSYDQFGEDFLAHNINFDDISPFKIFSNIFEKNKFFNKDNMFCMTGNIEEDIKNFAQKFINLKPLIVKLEYTLEDCYFGREVTKTITKKVHQQGRLFDRLVNITINIPRGVRNKQRKILKKDGNQDLSGKKGDLIIVFIEKPHSYFKRMDEHLYIEKKILLSEALGGVEFIINPISGGKMILETNKDEVIDGDTIHYLEGFGLPIHTKTNYGNLYVSYKIVFPKNLPKDRKELLCKILPNRNSLSNQNKSLYRKKLKMCNSNELVNINQKKTVETNPFGLFGNFMKNPIDGVFSMGIEINNYDGLDSFNANSILEGGEGILGGGGLGGGGECVHQ